MARLGEDREGGTIMKTLFPVPAIVLFCFCLTAFAQDDLLATVIPPAGAGLPSAETMQASANVPETAVSAAPKKETAGEWEQELLRDPFWPVGFFPPDWQRKADVLGQPALGDEGGWKAASAKLRVSGTSRLGDRTAAIINGEMRKTGDQVQVLHEGKTYQWEIIGIGADGQIQLKKMGIR